MSWINPEVWLLLEPRIHDEQVGLVDKVMNGGCKTFESYCEAVGRFRAFNNVKDFAKELSKPDAPDSETEQEEE